MLEPNISVYRALFLTVVGIFSFWLAYLLIKRKKDSRYPNLYAAIVCVGAGLWVIDSVIVDRVTQQNLILLFGKLTYVIPYISFFFFYLFVKNFPKKTNTKKTYFFALSALTVTALATIIILLPQNFVVYSLIKDDKVISNHNVAIYLAVMAGLVYLMSLIVDEVYFKWKSLGHWDKKSIKLIIMGIVFAFIPAVVFSIINALFIPDSSFYQYVYPPIIIFIYFFAYVILKFGALDAGITFSKKAVVGTVVIALMFGLLFLLL